MIIQSQHCYGPVNRIDQAREAVAALYARLFTGPAAVRVELIDITEFQTADMAVFAGRETGEFSHGEIRLPLAVRTSRVAQWLGAGTG